MRRSLFLMVLLVGCAHAGRSKVSLRPAWSFQWSYPVEIAPAELIEAQGLYLPDPSIEQLAAAKLPRIDGQEKLYAAVRFCVGDKGKTKDVAIERSTGEAELDELLRATFSKWRFKPAIIRGRQVIDACTTVRFDVVFEQVP